MIGDLSRASETRELAAQVNAHGRMDAVIHNAGVYLSPGRVATPEGHSRTLAINVLAPYILTALIERPHRLIYLSSGMHRAAGGNLQDIDWTRRRWDASAAYSESKLYVSALSAAVARQWTNVLSNSGDPRAGSPSALTRSPRSPECTGTTAGRGNRPRRSPTLISRTISPTNWPNSPASRSSEANHRPGPTGTQG
ncbi:hypothetical protein SRABI128_06495 [Microbacterium sp. Bi128]|nr:hypothetical protein SRABI128_06495 [Microbacterium sp. Bi128]